MRKIIVSEFITLDGVMEGPGSEDPFPRAGWSMAYFDPGIGKIKFDELFAGDALLLGRVTYEGFAAAWPGRTDEMGFADRMNSIPKYVVSTTLSEPTWNATHVIKEKVVEQIARLKEKVVEQIARLKEQPGQDILVAGSSTLTRTLAQHTLVDEYRLLVYPVVLGSGKRLFEAIDIAALKLIESRAFENSVLYLRYVAAQATD